MVKNSSYDYVKTRVHESWIEIMEEYGDTIRMLMQDISSAYVQNDYGLWLGERGILIPSLYDILYSFRNVNLHELVGIIITEGPDLDIDPTDVPVVKDKVGAMLSEYLINNRIKGNSDRKLNVASLMESGVLVIYACLSGDSVGYHTDWIEIVSQILSDVQNDNDDAIPVLTLIHEDSDAKNVTQYLSDNVPVFKHDLSDFYMSSSILDFHNYVLRNFNKLLKW